MLRTTSGLLLAAGFITYLAFGDRGQLEYSDIERTALAEAAIDRGPILEIILRCPGGTAIISYSKVEQLYCSPELICDRRIEPVVARACR